MIIGSHVSFGKEQLLGALKEALSYDANTFMFYTGAPTNTIRKEIDENLTSQAHELMQKNNISLSDIICHAPYIVNSATGDLEKRNFCISFLQKELQRCDQMGITKMVLHPGSSVGIERQEALDNIVYVLNEVLKINANCKILLETMAGKGSECGITIEEITYIISNVQNKDQIGVCLDTCHLNDAGYDMSNFDAYLDQFARNLPIDYIGCIHVNDSKNPLGSHKDRHANIGKGQIGFASLLKVVYNERLSNIPKILETPYIGDTDEDKERLYPPYKEEIKMLRNKEYNPNYFTLIRDTYKEGK